MILLLDSSVRIDVLRRRRSRPELLANLVLEGHQLATSVINVAEIHAGMRPDEQTRTEALLADLLCFPIDTTIATRAGFLKRTYASSGLTLALPDLLIASTALAYDLTLITDNRKHFPMPEVRFYPLA